MKYIVKGISEPMAVHKVELILCKSDKASLIKPDNRYANLSGEQLYDKVREMTTFANLKQLLYDEQGGICCYCGMKLEYPFNPQFRVEHVKPRDSHRELVGEYENLLLSCRATKEELEIRRHTPNSKERRKHFHCDEAKGAEEITYSPLTPDCESAFIYGIDGSITGIDDAANKDIEILGLGCGYLKRRRSEAISAWFDDNISSEDLLKCKAAIMSRDKDNRLAEFCFVISNVIEQFL